jgi:hypothetical protein
VYKGYIVSRQYISRLRRTPKRNSRAKLSACSYRARKSNLRPPLESAANDRLITDLHPLCQISHMPSFIQADHLRLPPLTDPSTKHLTFTPYTQRLQAYLALTSILPSFFGDKRFGILTAIHAPPLVRHHHLVLAAAARRFVRGFCVRNQTWV